RVKGDDLPAGVNYCVFDAAVNSGTGRAAKWLQEAVGAVADGAIGPNTLAKVAAHDADSLVNAYCDIRLNFLKSLKTFDTFGKGWTRRVDGVRQAALDASRA
ncbi:MAG TPA: putative peptidoglycan-binding domain-containing protein, partial [Pseudomonadales bacterium]|nr:putative peptidoglycan-binding domain-containing protein [Pseudomonadales bacterium]